MRPVCVKLEFKKDLTNLVNGEFTYYLTWYLSNSTMVEESVKIRADENNAPIDSHFKLNEWVEMKKNCCFDFASRFYIDSRKV